MAKGEFLLDGQVISFEAGQTVMEAAQQAGVYIPHLCHHADFKPHGSCKLCTVLVNGRPSSACTMPASEGQEVLSETDFLHQERLRLTQMLFVEGNHICPGCEKSGDCSLQALAYHLGMQDNHYPHFFPRRRLDASHPDLVLDRDRCILCALCVRAAREVDGKDLFDIVGRGLQSRLAVNAPSGRLSDTAIDAGDRAARICPVGALLPKRTAFQQPIGSRRFDRGDITEQDPRDGEHG